MANARFPPPFPTRKNRLAGPENLQIPGRNASGGVNREQSAPGGRSAGIPTGIFRTGSKSRIQSDFFRVVNVVWSGKSRRPSMTYGVMQSITSYLFNL